MYLTPVDASEPLEGSFRRLPPLLRPQLCAVLSVRGGTHFTATPPVPVRVSPVLDVGRQARLLHNRSPLSLTLRHRDAMRLGAHTAPALVVDVRRTPVLPLSRLGHALIPFLVFAMCSSRNAIRTRISVVRLGMSVLQRFGDSGDLCDARLDFMAILEHPTRPLQVVPSVVQRRRLPRLSQGNPLAVPAPFASIT